MKRLMVRMAFVVFLLSTKSHAQSGAVIPRPDAGHASQASCVILKRMGRGDRTKSRLYSFGISGKQFRYMEGKLPEGFSPHRNMTDQDVRNLQARGAQILVLDSHYTADDLKEARADCQGQAATTLSQAEEKAPPIPAPIAGASTPAPKPFTAKALTPKADDSASSTGTTGVAVGAPASAKAPAPKADDSASTRTIEPAASTSTPAPAPKPPKAKAPTAKAEHLARSTGTAEAALVDISSTPAGADVYIDEHFFGQTPATTIILVPGNHKVAVKKDGFVVWKKELNLPSGRTNVDAELLPKTK